MAGKGDDYRPVDKKKFDETMDRIFGNRDPLEFQKGKRYDSKENPGENPFLQDRASETAGIA